MLLLRKLFDMAWEFFVEVFGALAGEEIRKKGWLPMLAAILYAGWDIVVSPLGPMLFINFLAVFALGLLVTNQIQMRRLQGKLGRGELTPPNVLVELETLRAKVTALEDVQPCLIHEPIIISRTITYSQQPRYLSAGGGGFAPQSYHYNARDSVFFALLRITNVPKSTNSEAIAWKIYADVTYCDSQGKQLFPSVSGVWVEPDHRTELRAIGCISSDCPSLRPNEKAYLGLTIGYFLNGGQMQCGALTASSPAHRDWLHPETLLSSGVSDGAVNIKVVMGCDGFRTESYYLLDVNDKEKKLVLKPTSGPL